MIIEISVSADRYRITQNQSTLAVTYYAMNQLVKTESSETRYTTDELYNMLFNWALSYQNERREVDE